MRQSWCLPFAGIKCLPPADRDIHETLFESAGRLNREGRAYFLDELVAQGTWLLARCHMLLEVHMMDTRRWRHPRPICAGRAAWLDKGKSRAMILWKTHAEWADAIYSWACGFGLNDSVLTVDDLSSGDDVESTGGEHFASC